ncbi:probable disease resistance protein At4g27220 [Lycium barbarum]|uniref:probable disease resistance protein At4g27220 n=1 Tax=Lycium barbarum TaxID=112863 RepID=UPI00293EC4F9|nr:probable disease resistance protein At4g27220 [Lycium barbarum]XP_060177579.1 probable disease resistance protein At4g27220 [Lycium barbarum]
MALEIVGLITEPVVNYIVKPIGRPLGYLMFYRRNIQNLKDEMEKLDQIRADVVRSKEEEERNLRSVATVTEGWLKETDDIRKKTNTILPSEADIGKGCLSQGLISRYVVSRKAKKIIDVVIQQRNEGSGYVKTMCIVSKKDADEDDGMSRQLIMADIIKALNDEEINMIGICGPGGVGKTRMEKKVIAKVEGENLFDKVVFTVVSQPFNLENLQASIAEQLGLKLNEKDKNIRAVRLNTRLNNEYKILLILDDVWEKLDLEEVGIPLGEEHKGCKVILTSRSYDICSSMFRTGGKIFTIESLTEEESWVLFRRNAGDRTNDPALYQTAKQICKECGGIPLGILTVANALKDTSQDIWEGALTQLKSVVPEDITGLREVYNSLKLSYDQLKNDEAKKLYLHCGLFPEDYSIPLETLARRGMSLGMFSHINSLQEARIKVKLLVDKLKNCFLLQKDKDDSSVKMHDALRDLAIYISSRERRHFGISHDLKLKQWPRNIYHEEVTCISVRSHTTIKHPKTLNCPRLEFLEIGAGGGGVSYLDDDIFHGTRGLKTIEVSYMRFSLMPSSIGLLKNLRMLRLFRCEMEDISLIGELVKLEILSMRASIFRVFPAELGKLEKLRLLDLNSCHTIERIEPGVLSSFLELEELDMEGCFAVEWEVENKVEQNKAKNVALAELHVMQNLTTLSIDISDGDIPKDTSLPGGLTEFFIRIWSSGISRSLRSMVTFGTFGKYDSKYSKTVWCCSDEEHVVDWISNIVVHAEDVVLRKSVTSHVIDLLARESFQHVKFLDASGHKELRYLANMSDFPGKTPSQYTNCFANLEHLSISNCEDIVYFLPMPVVSTTLPLLKNLEIDSCKKLEQVFLLEEDNRSGGHGISQIDKVKFPRLETIKLANLEALNGFCNGTHNIELPSLSTLRIRNLPNIRGFFSNQSANMHFLFGEKDALASLKNLELGYMDDAMLLCYQLVSHCCFRGLEHLSIWNCKNLPPDLFIDPVNDARIISAEEEEKEYGENVAANSLLFPHLKYLLLYGLPDLRHVVSLNMQKVPFANVKSIEVNSCDRLLHFSSLSVARTFSQHVQKLSFVDCEEMEQVFVLEDNEVEGADQSQIPDIQFPRLQELSLDNLQALTSFCKGVNNIEFPNLRYLRISGLSNINGFVIPTYGEQFNGMNFLFGTKVSFGGLKYLILRDLDSELWFHQLCSRTPSFRELEELNIYECDKIRNLFSSSSSSIGALVNLKRLEIWNCSRIEAVIVEEGEGMSMKLQFLKLEYLWLCELPKLGSFSQSKHGLHLPSLEKLRIDDCGEMQTFAQGYINTPRLKHLTINYEDVPVDDINNSLRH